MVTECRDINYIRLVCYQITVHKIHTYFSDTSLSIYLLFSSSYFFHVYIYIYRIGLSINKTSSHRVASSRFHPLSIPLQLIELMLHRDSNRRFSSRPLCSINETLSVGFQSRFCFFLFTILRCLCNNSLKIVSLLLQSAITITFFWLNKSCLSVVHFYSS